MKAFIIGKGKVGRATQQALGEDIPFHDPYHDCFIDTPNDFDLAIVCVPSLNQGPGDYSHLLQVFDYLDEKNFQGIAAIRSTVEPLNIQHIISKYTSFKVVLFPEFMKQSEDVVMDKPWLVVLGCDSLEHKESFCVAEFIRSRNPLYIANATFCTIKEAAAIKLFQNSVLAAKVTLFNTIYQYCLKHRLNFNAVKTAVAWDPRIGLQHTDVPGPDGLLGFGGHCLPKDLEALISSFQSLDINKEVWETIRDYNQRIRYG